MRPIARTAGRGRLARTLGGLVGLGIAAASLVGVAAPARASSSYSITADEGFIGGPTTQLYALGLSTNSALLTDHGNSMSAGNTVDVYHEVDTANTLPQANQLWQWVPDNGVDDLYQGGWGLLKNSQSGLCLNIKGGASASYGQLIQWPCGAYSNEEFKAVALSPGSKQFTVVSQLDPTMGVGVGTAGCRPADNTPSMTLPTAAYGACTQWTARRMGGTVEGIANSSSTSYVLDSLDTDQSWLTQAGTHQRDTNRNAEQEWYLQRVGTTQLHSVNAWGSDQGMQSAPVYRIVSVHGTDWADATCLEAAGGNPQVGAVVDSYGCDPNGADQANQEWILDSYLSYGGGSGTVNTAVMGGVGSGKFVAFNGAMLNSAQGTSGYPVLSISSTIAAFNGSHLTMENQNSTTIPTATQLWSWYNPNPPASGSGSGSGSGGSGGGSGGSANPPCVGFGCLLG